MSWKEKINPERLPGHIAIIMDGNGRWAMERGQHRVFGHENGVRAVRDVTEACAEIGVKFLTLYAFSTENWNRPQMEVDALMSLLVKTLHAEMNTLQDNKIRLQIIGDLDSLTDDCREELMRAIRETENNNHMTLVLALSYSARWEITEAVKKIAGMAIAGDLVPANITQDSFAACLSTNTIPDPELLIRTSGEHRISNFLLWQIAYAELYFTSVLWPDFSKENLYEAIVDFQGRERRFGMTSEQLTSH